MISIFRYNLTLWAVLENTMASIVCPCQIKLELMIAIVFYTIDNTHQVASNFSSGAKRDYKATWYLVPKWTFLVPKWTLSRAKIDFISCQNGLSDFWYLLTIHIMFLKINKVNKIKIWLINIQIKPHCV